MLGCKCPDEVLVDGVQQKSVGPLRVALVGQFVLVQVRPEHFGTLDLFIEDVLVLLVVREHVLVVCEPKRVLKKLNKMFIT